MNPEEHREQYCTDCYGTFVDNAAELIGIPAVQTFLDRAYV